MSYKYQQGTKPLLISMPHNSSDIPADVALTMTQDAQQSKDTDWFVDRLYDFAKELGVHILEPQWSRYYIDLNRDPAGKNLYPGADNTELCPITGFDNKDIYLSGMEPDEKQIKERITNAWLPYHLCIKDVVAEMVAIHGYAILFDAHSIRSVVPRFFEGQLPDFNFGTRAGESCDGSLLTAIEQLNFQPWSRVSNGRFKGGYITRQYGEPDNNVHAIQLELSQATYLNEIDMSWNSEKANSVKSQLLKIIKTLLQWKQ